MFLKSKCKGLLCTLAFAGLAQAQDVKPFQPFEISVNKSLSSPTFSAIDRDSFFQNSLQSNHSGFDFLNPQKKGYHLSTKSDGMFGEELIVGMKFADWLTLRLNVIDEDQAFDLFSGPSMSHQSGQAATDLMGYQVGVSSVLNLSNKWRLGIDVGMGRVGGEWLGLYQDQVETTRLGFGIRNSKFGATFQSDFMNGATQNDLEQSTMDLQVDWHFTKDGTISFGARRNIRENTTNGTSLDELTGTVPYIKFKHNL